MDWISIGKVIYYEPVSNLLAIMLGGLNTIIG